MFRRAVFSAAALVFAAMVLTSLAALFYLHSLDALLVEKFSGRRWDFPSKVYADSTLVYPGIDTDAIGLRERLERLQYREVGSPPARPGEFRHVDGAIELYLRDFTYPSGPQPARQVRIALRDGVVRAIADARNEAPLVSIEIEPEVIAGLYQDIWEERRVISLNQIPATLVNAILAVEDQRFFEHAGIDWIGTARALWVNVTRGRVVQGGSTLTQQLMKNFFLTEERTLRRKLREAAMAILAERRYSKREILENYLNEIYWGQNGPQGIFGVWQASRFYFHKEPAALTLPECAMLAGMIKAPNAYSPFRHPERTRERRNQALRLMREEGIISKGELASALEEPLRVIPPKRDRTDAPYFVDFVRRELADGYPEEVLTREGLAILTALDAEMQRAAERALRDGIAQLERDYPRLAKGPSPVQACLIALHPQTGEIKAMVGGRDYGQTQFNRVSQARRQPGSIFKPFTYLAALDHQPGSKRVLPTSMVEDEPFTWEYDRKTWSPENYKQTYFGQVTVRQALERSLNAATARLARQVGLERIRDTAYRMGISSELPLYPAMVLGAVEVTPLEVARAYSVLANQGLRTTPIAVRSVADPTGRVVERHPMELQQALRPEVAYLVTHLMEGVLERGTGSAARAHGFQRPAAGKTGTTNDYRDAWFAGFTPDLLAVVWVGFDDNRPVGLSGATAALPIWTAFMKGATRGSPVQRFTPPPGVRLVVIDPHSGALATRACPTTIEEAFLSGDEPTQPCPLHVPFVRFDSSAVRGRPTFFPISVPERSGPWIRHIGASLYPGGGRGSLLDSGFRRNDEREITLLSTNSAARPGRQ